MPDRAARGQSRPGRGAGLAVQRRGLGGGQAPASGDRLLAAAVTLARRGLRALGRLRSPRWRERSRALAGGQWFAGDLDWGCRTGRSALAALHVAAPELGQLAALDQRIAAPPRAPG